MGGTGWGRAETPQQPAGSKRKKWKRALLQVAAGLLIVWLIGCAVIYSYMRKPPEAFGRFMMKLPVPVAFIAFPFETMWMRARGGSLQVGDTAPDFQLSRVDHSASVQLAGLNTSQPVVLVFGSYT